MPQKDLACWKLLRKSLKAGTPAVLMMVVENSSGSPGRQGFKMVLTADGTDLNHLNLHGAHIVITHEPPFH